MNVQDVATACGEIYKAEKNPAIAFILKENFNKLLKRLAGGSNPISNAITSLTGGGQ